ncbi:MAG TPA: maltotransferase domain-containing protein [Casimicrobiaceae bacterium]|nr:maltotransferase domain-containing protein [Casimicrobiaceae bacterium]
MPKRQEPPSERVTPRETLPQAGRARVVIEAISPAVDGGRFAVKRIVGDRIEIEADCFADGHDMLGCVLLHRAEGEDTWREVSMLSIGNDRWRGAFTVTTPGAYVYTITAWVDAFLSWRHDFARRTDADDLRIAAQSGAELIEVTAEKADGTDRQQLVQWARQLRSVDDVAALRTLALNEELCAVALRYPDRRFATTFPVLFPLRVDRERARCGAWYEMFVRSSAATPGAHGTLRDCIERLPYVAAMGFDVLYLPPVHPIGRERRKGRNNALAATPADVGSPWAIGAAEGGHKALLRDLGTMDEFRALVAAADAQGLEVALDIAFQCAPDHPYVRAHPDWFRHRADGTVQYAENPPKKYQDIYPFNFESDDWQALWRELASVFGFWIDAGVRIFRVDNPHTKPFPFWEWAIGEIKRSHPDVLFLSEAFTRPKVMHRLAKLGFTQSYTYFTWRNTKAELTAYFTELTRGPGRDYFRPNCWPNTPDILPEPLQIGGRPAFIARLVLAATLAANYGIYGPAFELMESAPRETGSEEYAGSEKYELRHWDLDRADSLAGLIGRVNAARRENPALQRDDGLRFVPVDNDDLIAYTKVDPGGANVVLTIVNLDPHHVQSGWVTLDLADLGISAERTFQVHDLLTDARYLWTGARNFVMLDPARVPAHVFRVRHHVRTEHDFDYFL